MKSAPVHAAETSELTDADFSADRIALLIEQLDRSNVRTRIEAIESLNCLGAEARAAIPKLVDLLADDAWDEEYGRNYVHRAAERALIAMGAESVEILVSNFPAQSDEVKGRTISLVRTMGHSARAFVPLLHKRFASEPKDRLRSLAALAAIDPSGQTALAILLRTLRDDKDASVRREAAEWLSRSEFREIVYWTERGSAKDWFPRQDSSATADALILALKDQSPEVRGPAALSLSTYPEASRRSVPALIMLLNDDNEYGIAYSNHVFGGELVKAAAAKGLSRFHEFADQSLSALVNAIKNEDEPALNGFSDAFADLIRYSKRPMEHLSELLVSRHRDVAFMILARGGNESRAVIPKLRALISQGEERPIIEQALKAISQIDFEGQPNDEEIGSVAPKLIENFNTQLSFEVEENENKLFRLGSGVVRYLIDALKKPGDLPRQRTSCINVLGRLGPASSDAIEPIVSSIESKHPSVREAAAIALGRIASQPGNSLSALERLLSDPRVIVRAASATSCAQFGPSAERTVRLLVKGLSEDYLEVKVAAATALGQLGSVAQTAIPDLDQMAKSENLLLHDSAADALQRIRMKSAQ